MMRATIVNNTGRTVSGQAVETARSSMKHAKPCGRHWWPLGAASIQSRRSTQPGQSKCSGSPRPEALDACAAVRSPNDRSPVALMMPTRPSPQQARTPSSLPVALAMYDAQGAKLGMAKVTRTIASEEAATATAGKHAALTSPTIKFHRSGMQPAHCKSYKDHVSNWSTAVAVPCWASRPSTLDMPWSAGACRSFASNHDPWRNLGHGRPHRGAS